MGLKVLGFGGLGFWGSGFRVLGFEFWVLGFEVDMVWLTVRKALLDFLDGADGSTGLGMMWMLPFCEAVVPLCF